MCRITMNNIAHISDSSLIEKSLLEYKGRLTSEVRVQLLELLVCIALCNLGKRSDLKKLVGIALELLDNAQRYNSCSDVDFRWQIEDSQMVVTIRNKANGTDAMRLMKAVNTIEGMSKEGIAQAFREQLMSEGPSEKGGAGLGMLQIARKVGKNISAEIQPLAADQFMCTSKVSTRLDRYAKNA